MVTFYYGRVAMRYCRENGRLPSIHSDGQSEERENVSLEEAMEQIEIDPNLLWVIKE